MRTSDAPGRVLATMPFFLVACGPVAESPQSGAAAQAQLESEPPSEVYQYLDARSAREVLAKVTLEDGVSRDEAGAIAVVFFYSHSGVGCGAPDLIRRAESHWVISTRFGYAGDPGDDILVSSSDGSVLWRNRKCVDNPLAMLNEDYHSRCRN